MAENKSILLPSPIIDAKEDSSLKKLTERYDKLVQPGKISKMGNKAASLIPQPVKQVGKVAKNTIAEQELFIQCMKVIADGFGILEKQAARLAVPENVIIKRINEASQGGEIDSIDAICLARGYDISKIVSGYKTQDRILALLEGGATGAFGFAGLPFNIVLSTFLYYRAVQSIALHYGYDIKNDASELVIASDVFMSALSPESKGMNEVTELIGKIMVMTEITTVKQVSKKTWEEMASRGGITLLICQMRALANKAAKNALEKAGQKGLEESLFKGVFEQIGKKLTKQAVGKSIPFVGAFIGALFDIAQMNKVLEYADVFYNKRFLIEKEVRINILFGYEDDEPPVIIDKTNCDSGMYAGKEGFH